MPSSPAGHHAPVETPKASAKRQSITAALGVTGLGTGTPAAWADSGEEGEVELPFQVAVRGLTPGAVASVSVHSRRWRHSSVITRAISHVTSRGGSCVIRPSHTAISLDCLSS